MCALNSMPYIMSSVESFRQQTNVEKELIVIYSDSNDNTEYYLESIKEKNIKKFNFNGSIYESLNFGISKASGDIIGTLHSDDVFFSRNTLNYVNKEFIKKKIDVLYGNILFSKKNNLLEITRTWQNVKILNKYDLPPHTGTFIKKKIFKKLNYSNKYSIASDTDFLIKLFNTKIKFNYLNKFICIMRSGGLSTSGRYFYKKFLEDIKIYNKNGLSLVDYLKKLSSKSKQFFYLKNLNSSIYLKKINNYSKVKFLKENDILKSNGKIISALNLAYIAFNYKFNFRNHNHKYWSDGIFSTISTNKNKKPGRKYFLKLLSKLNNSEDELKIYILGDIPEKTRIWLKKKLKIKYVNHKLPYGSLKNIIKSTKKLKFYKNDLIILTLPTPKQELLANFLIKKFSYINILCIGGSLNILSGYEKETPNILYKLNLEWLWRLRFDTNRRFERLVESGILYLKLKLSGKNSIF